MPDLSVVLPFYRNSRMLWRQLTIWRDEWPEALKARCEIVIVDDGSPEPAIDEVSAVPDVGIPISVYRVLEDRPWHQHGARNLGAYVASGDWLLLTDMDHVIPADTLLDVLAQIETAGKKTVFTFARRDAPTDDPAWRSDGWSCMAHTLNDRGELKPHVNSYALRRKFYWQVGGYDESYCGVYGTDRLFRDRLFKRAQRVDLALPLIRVGREVIPDASTTTLSRKDGRDPSAKKCIAREKAARGEADKIVTLNFPWERVL